MTPIIRKGDRSQQVSDVQIRLRALGAGIDDDLGYFGESTQQAVRTFQRQRHVNADGVIGPNTWSELVEAGWRLGDRPLYLRSPLLRGDDVLTLQARLNALGFDSGHEDGIFGTNTDAAVRSFQREYGIPKDGIFGARSHAALVGLRADRPHTAAHLREELQRSAGAGINGALVIIDPGHGGKDRGELGPRGVAEADLCWDLANRLARLIVGAGAQVRFTRTETETPDTSERAARANAWGGDVFLSLHLNAHGGQNARGASTSYFPRSRGGELLAEKVQEQLVKLGLGDCRSHARAYPILRETRMPAVLVEPAFITNPDEADRLRDLGFRAALAQAVAAAIRAYYEQESRVP